MCLFAALRLILLDNPENALLDGAKKKQMTAADLSHGKAAGAAAGPPSRPVQVPGPFIEADGKSRRAMNWLFADKDRMFWALQTAGWIGFFFLHVLSVSSLLS